MTVSVICFSEWRSLLATIVATSGLVRSGRSFMEMKRSRRSPAAPPLNMSTPNNKFPPRGHLALRGFLFAIKLYLAPFRVKKVKNILALFVISASVFAQDITFAKEDPNLKKISIVIYLESPQGESQLLIGAIRSYENGDLTGISSAGMFAVNLTYVHKYGADGRISERTEYESGEAARAWIYTYNDDGSWELNGYPYDENGERSEDPIYVEKWCDGGKILSAEWKLEGYKTVHRYFYDENGRLVKMEETPEGAAKPISWDVYKYTHPRKPE